MKLANIATVKSGNRLELHLSFNTNEDLLEAYAQITRNEESQASVARLEQKIEELESEIRNCYERLSEDGL
jgi:hypothetical protein